MQLPPASLLNRDEAYDAATKIVIDYMPPDSGISVQQVLEELLRIVDKTSAPEGVSADQLDLPLAA